MVNQTAKSKRLGNIFKELNDIYTLYEIRQEALLFCYEENKDYGHIFALDSIFLDKFKRIIENFKEVL